MHQTDLKLSAPGDWTEIQAMAAPLDRPIETEDVPSSHATPLGRCSTPTSGGGHPPAGGRWSSC
ncbi:hypothetical protein [Nonomuraea basaltis]|uniref:hypothetical protein n=1 Tax=Nonomuraea basaltis TaxID=2495887 RepID=UPI00110C6E3C|nr:hypothetical protein [Nonomuraea basaltis]TMR91372.1 hypothetical protein EJK15_50320 [Nonomuraea basaltis]